MNIAKHTFPGDIELFNLGDVHRGEEACDVRLWLETLRYIERTPNAYWVSTGDLATVAMRQGKFSAIYHAKKLDEELEDLRNELTPIAGRCLGLVGSNHHARVENEIGMSLDKLMARELEIPFLGDMGVVNLVCDKASYMVAMHHGVGHGKKRGAKANSLAEMAEVIPGADLYLTGHTHTFEFFIEDINYLDRKRGRLATYHAYFCCTGHFLKWEDSYAQALRLKPAPLGAAHLKLKAAGAGNASYKKITSDLFN